VLLSGATVVTPDEVLDDGWVEVAGERITAVGSGATPAGAVATDLTGRWLVPGFVDVHVHGGGGASYTTGDRDQARTVADLHRRHGTTTTFASLVTAPLPTMRRSIAALADLVVDGTLAGLHLEGPFLAASRCGAHDPAHLRPPDRDELADLLAAGHGTVTHVTVAPELPGGVDLVRQLVDEGVVAAVGHSDATHEQAAAAFAAGARLATHLYNAMRPVHHREPGVVVAALEDDRVTVELVNDGVHLHDAIVRSTFRHVGAERVALVTDAIVAAGAGDGVHGSGRRTIEVSAGVARLAGSSTIAGSTLTMDVAVRRAVQAGLALPAVARAAATTPARALGLEGVGTVTPGSRADLVVLDAGLAVRGVLARGRWVDGPPS
jgi:N-acetylglucosamine-6-phosphate deacetylase